jgi:hypothetical protein
LPCFGCLPKPRPMQPRSGATDTSQPSLKIIGPRAKATYLQMITPDHPHSRASAFTYVKALMKGVRVEYVAFLHGDTSLPHRSTSIQLKSNRRFQILFRSNFEIRIATGGARVNRPRQPAAVSI